MLVRPPSGIVISVGRQGTMQVGRLWNYVIKIKLGSVEECNCQMRISLTANRKQRLNSIRESPRFKCKCDIERSATAAASNLCAGHGSLAGHFDIVTETLLS